MTTKTTKIQAAVAAVEQAEKALQDMHAQAERCADATKTGADYTGQIAELQRQRAEATGAAFLAGTVADTSSVDKQIAALEKKTADARSTAAAAEVAAGLLASQIDAAEAEAAAARNALQATIADEMQATFDAAEIDYHKAASALKVALATMAAAGNVRDKATGARPSRCAAGILDSLNGGLFFGAAGLVTKQAIGPTAGQYFVDSDIARGLRDQINVATEKLKAELAAQGVPSEAPAPGPIEPSAAKGLTVESPDRISKQPEFLDPKTLLPPGATKSESRGFQRSTYRSFTLNAGKPIDGNPAANIADADYATMTVADALAGEKSAEVQQ